MKNMIRKLIAPGLGLSLLFTGGTAEAFASEHVSNNLNTIKPIFEVNDITTSNKGKGKDKKKDKEREKFIKTAVEHAFQAENGKYTIVVANLDDTSFTTTIYNYKPVYDLFYDGSIFRVYMFEFGSFTFPNLERLKPMNLGFKGNCYKKDTTLSCFPF